MDALPWQRRIARSFTLQVALIGSVLLFMWLTEAADTFLFRGGLDQFGVWPHHLLGLRGILFAPFLHANFAHLATNSVPFAFLGWLILVRGWSDYLIVTLVVMVSSGLGAWIFGAPNSIHIGASGVVFGYFGFLLLRAVYERSLVAMSSALVVILLYGSFIWGVFPLIMGVSWQMHLFGFIGGALIARSLADRRAPALNEESADDDHLVIDYGDLEYPEDMIRLTDINFDAFDFDLYDPDDPDSDGRA